ncbi:hypothetical protein FIBSPDRAFT_866413, partial [Athelia psychrophila]
MWLERELRDVMRIGMELLKPRVEGLGLQRQQGAEQVTVSSTSGSDSTWSSLRQDPKPPRTRRSRHTKFSDPSTNSVARHD